MPLFRRRDAPTTSPQPRRPPMGTGGGDHPAPPATPIATTLAEAGRWSLRILLVTAVVVGALWVVGRMWVVVLPALLGLLLSTALWPLARRLRRVVPAAAAAGAAVLTGLLVLGGLVAAVTYLVLDEVDSLSEQFSQGVEDIEAWLAGPPLDLGDDEVGDLVGRAVDQVQDSAQDIAAWTLTGVSTASSWALTALLALVLCFFFLKDGPRFLPWLEHWLSPGPAAHAAEVSRRSWTALGGFVRAQAAVGLVDAIGIGIGLLVLGVPLALPLAVITFLAAFVPVVGAVVAGALAAVVALATQGLTTALIVVGLVLVVQQLEGNVLQPLLMGKTLSLHPAMTIVVVTLGSTLAGITGAFLAVPVLAVLTTTARYARELTVAARERATT
ncbi:AI-2E family transporter [Nocardioides kribbensis]|uniref:AI-2E family transporter n=1 Tax=Nocardioides kribbensis TaxID=305517 RepID=UPI0032DA0A3D